MDQLEKPSYRFCMIFLQSEYYLNVMFRYIIESVRESKFAIDLNNITVAVLKDQQRVINDETVFKYLKQSKYIHIQHAIRKNKAIFFNLSRQGDTYISVNWSSFSSDNGVLPDWRQVIIGVCVCVLLIGSLGTNFTDSRLKTIYIQ